jgi:putative peptidoglycan lipid II flippase
MVTTAKRFLARANRGQTVTHAAVLISFAFFMSRILGFLRDRLLVAHFGLGSDLSAYYAAFRLPDLLFTLLVSGAFAVSFIPVFTEYLQADDRETAWKVTSSLLNLLSLGTIIGGVLIIIFAGPLTTLITPGFDPATHSLAVSLTRIMAVTPIFFAVSSVLGSIQQSFNRFVMFASAGILYNVGIILGIIFLTGRYGIYGAAIGVVIGVILQALVQFLGLFGLGFKYHFVFTFKLSGVRKALKLMVPRSIDQGIDQINYVVETIIGSTISIAAIGQFSLANNLKNVPLVLIGSSITTAVFPRLAARAAAGAREHLIETYVQTAKFLLFLAIPSALFCWIARGYIVRLLYGFGNAATANTLGWFAGTIIFSSLFMLVSRVFFAMQDTKTPLYTSLGSIPLNIILSIILARRFGVSGLAMSASFVAALETIVLAGILRHREGNFGERQITIAGLKMLTAGAFMSALTYIVINQFLPLYATDKGFLTLAPKFLEVFLIACISYIVPCYLLRITEAKTITQKMMVLMQRSLGLT